jgi:hypothetical protein
VADSFGRGRCLEDLEEAAVRSGKITILIEAGKWVFLIAGVLGAYFSFAAWFLVPGVVDLNRLAAAGLFASLAISAFLLSGLFFRINAERDLHARVTLFRTLPMVICALFLLAFIIVSATAPWWGRR